MSAGNLQQKVGSLRGYAWYVPVVFVYYLLSSVADALSPTTGGAGTLAALLLIMGNLLIWPFVVAGMVGEMHSQQSGGGRPTAVGFLRSTARHYWRVLGAGALGLGLFVCVATLTVIPQLTAAASEPAASRPSALGVILDSVLSAVNLLWFCAVVVERKVILGLVHSVTTILRSPVALGIAVVWGLLSALGTYAADSIESRWFLALHAGLALVLAAARVILTAYALAVFKAVRGEVWEPEAQGPDIQAPATRDAEGFAKASLGFTFLSFLPLLSVVALVLGILAIHRKRGFVLRGVLAVVCGGFATAFYALLAAGFLVGLQPTASDTGRGFLAEENAVLQEFVRLYDAGQIDGARAELDRVSTRSEAQHWTVETASALMSSYSGDLQQAILRLDTAARQEPERSEFWLLYGAVLLRDGQHARAAGYFEAAAQHQPHLPQAARYKALIESAYAPSGIARALMLVLVLLLLFAFHEYGHAFAAWKMGDDTAKSQGRLTLNPIKHLDPIGSILLPGVLLWRQADVVFGWAKPVPVDPAKFKDPRKDHMLVSFAGPAVNLLVAMVCFLVIGALLVAIRLGWPDAISLNLGVPFGAVSLVGVPYANWVVVAFTFLVQLLYTSLVLGFFNLIPVPPLDGSWILSGVLPSGLRNVFERGRRFGFVVFLLLVVTPVVDYVLVIPMLVASTAMGILRGLTGLG